MCWHRFGGLKLSRSDGSQLSVVNAYVGLDGNEALGDSNDEVLVTPKPQKMKLQNATQQMIYGETHFPIPVFFRCPDSGSEKGRRELSQTVV